ncbi:hypothetical protein [Haloarcula marina]|uniref:hypothetical protein n=1 Tax=Haloarcula marina TaxID=2961574 RepID=UPI0020B82311|nr:hypothetical protein [Halomicroarcula marina]
MRYKVAPPARSLAFLADVREAVPLVPGEEADCCRAIQRATDVPDRETARESLIFVEALGLVASGERGYYRRQGDFDREALAAQFRANVFAVAELLDALDVEPKTVDEAFDAVRSVVPRWERERRTDWEADWRRRTEHLLEWSAVFGLTRQTDRGYEAA